ncbi:MAG: hypothetical protein U0637_02505 [Phycisphaerales bacterium]
MATKLLKNNGVPAGLLGVSGPDMERLRASACAGCGYDLRGLSGGTCPECGAPVSRAG